MAPRKTVVLRQIFKSLLTAQPFRCENNDGIFVCGALGSAPKRPSICFVLDDATPAMRDRQIADDTTSFYVVERRDWPRIKGRLEAMLSAPIEGWCAVVDFDPKQSYGDLFMRIAAAATRETYRQMAR